MTYLQLVNAVMRRLREDEVTTINETDYSTLLSDFVNDPKRLVADAWDWTALRDTTTITTVIGTADYSLTGYGQRSKVLYVHNDTDNNVVNLQSLQYMNKQNLMTDDATGIIRGYAINGVDTNGDIKIKFYQTPNAVKSIKVHGVKRPDALSADADTVSVPTSPIIQWAYSYALRERGETGGESGAEQAIFAQNDLATAISLDAGQHPEELIWSYV